MNSRKCDGFAKLNMRLMATGILIIGLVGCRHDQPGADMNSGTIASELLVGIIGFAGDFMRSLLAAFLF